MIVEQGIFGPRYSATATLGDAIAGANDRNAVAWVGGVDVSSQELENLATQLGLGRQVLVEIAQRGRSARVARARITVLESGVHLVVAGVDMGRAGMARFTGELEMLATADCVAVMASGVPEAMQPPAIRERLESSLSEPRDSLSGGFVLGLVIAQVLDLYEDVLDELEEESIKLSEQVFERRDRDQLQRIYALSRPVHAAAVAIQPLLRGVQEMQDRDRQIEVPLSAQLRSEILHLQGRLERLDALLSSAQQSYFNLSQDEATRLMAQQGEITRRLSGYAVLIAIPTIVFSLYGTNFAHIPLLDKSWGYGVMLGVTLVLCVVAYWRLRKAKWI